MASSPERSVSPIRENEHQKRKTTKEGLTAGEKYSKFKNCDIIRLIDKMEGNPVLWDNTHPDYKDATLKKKLWWDVEKRLDFLKVNKGNNLKKIWTQLVGSYKEEQVNMRQRSGSGADDYEISFEFFEDMKFIDASLKQRIPESLESPMESVSTRVSTFGESAFGDRSRSSQRTTSSRNYHHIDTPKSEFLSTKYSNPTIPDSFEEKQGKLDKIMEMCMQSLTEPRRQPEEHRNLFQKINDTMDMLNPSEQFDLTMKIGTICNRVQQDKRAYSSSIAEMDEME